MNEDYTPKIQPKEYYLNPPQEEIGVKLVREFHRQNALCKIIEDYDKKFNNVKYKENVKSSTYEDN